MTGGVVSPSIDLGSELAGLLERAVADTLSNMAGFHPVAGAFQILDEAKIHGDISGIMNVGSRDWDGAFILTFPKATIFHILARIYKRSFDELNVSVQEAVAEFTNVIFGTFKSHLSQHGVSLSMSLPNLVMGDDHRVVSMLRGPSLLLPMEVAGLPFHIVFNIYKKT